MNKKAIILTGIILTVSSVHAIAAGCGDLSNATELSRVCPTASTIAYPPVPCNLAANTTYKVSKTIGSVNSPLPPITIPAGSALCIANSELSGKINLYLSSVQVKGVFQIGSPASPITSGHKVTITMAGSNSASPAPQPLCAGAAHPEQSCSKIAYATIKTKNARDITVLGSGKLLMYGAKGLTPVAGTSSVIHNISYASGTVDGQAIGSGSSDGDINQFPYFNNISGSNSWTYLNKPAGPAYYSAALNVQSPIALANYPAKLGGVSLAAADLPYLVSLSRNIASGTSHDWQSGDWISVSTTTFVSHETEIVQICQVYDIPNPDSQDNTSIPNTSVLVLAGSPSFAGKCPSVANKTPLKHYHFGSLAPTAGFFIADQTNYKNRYPVRKGQAKSFYDGSDRNFGIDERAEVALLSRNITLTSAAGTASKHPIHNINDQYFGGHIAIMNGAGHGDNAPAATVALVGVEIEKFGQPLVGRYPIHFHRLNADSSTKDINNLLVQDTSVHHSFNKCFVTHDTMGVRFYNNTCIRTIGQGFYLEDGYNIANNQYVHNLVAGTMSASLNYNPAAKNVKNQGGIDIGKNTYWDGDYLATSSFGYNPAAIPDTSDSGANTGNYIDSFDPSGFWITTFGSRISGANYPNVFVNNSVAGCQMRGAAYWSVLQDVDAFSSVPSTTKPTLYPVFSGNRGHACYDGFIAGNNSMVQANPPVAIGPQPLPVPVGQSVNTSANAPFVVFDNLNFTQIEHKAFWYRGVFIGVNNSRFAELKQGMTLLGGGGPEGNLLGFWGLVHDSVFAGVTNNNVGRYSDCEGYYKAYGSVNAKTLASDQALPLSTINEMVKCAPIDLSSVSTGTNIAASDNNTGLFGDIYPNFNFQGYTFYDGPARMEHNRFVNFRADVTNPAVFDNATNSYSGSKTRNLVTTIDAHRMMNYEKASQLSSGYTPGGNKHYGAIGDAAFSWLKGNAQSVPPTQYAKDNLWDNVNFKHQIFTEITNLSAGLKDGDKQTVEIDRGASLSGYTVCESKHPATCSGSSLNHYPISLNNLNIFATKSTTDEPHSQGRNNVVSSALMSPNKFATMNVEVGNAGSIKDLIVTRDMPAYGTEPAKTTYAGRGGLSYVYESMSMNNMGYTYSSNNLNGNNKFIFSYSDAPVDTTFINRIGFNIGKNATNITVYKAARQWNSGQNYLAKSPYWTGYGLTDTTSTCPSVLTNPSAYSLCQSHGTALTPYSDFSQLNTQFFNVLENNYMATATTKSGFIEGYYYDAGTGMLYFNMVQFAQAAPPPGVTLPPSVTPPYGTCDSSAYKKNRKKIVGYLKFSNPGSVGRVLDVGCYAESGKTKTSELLTCPAQGCAVYTVGFTTSAKTHSGSPASSATPAIHDGGTAAPTLNADGTITYGSPYTLYDASTNTALSPSSGSITVNGTLTRSYNYVSSGTSEQAGASAPLLPMPPSPANENGSSYTLTGSPSNITIIPYGGNGGNGGTGQIWTFATGASHAAGQAAKIQSADSSQFSELSPTQQSADEISIAAASSGNVATFRYSGTTATVAIVSTGATCTINFGSTTLSKGTGAGCSQITASGSTITVGPPPN